MRDGRHARHVHVAGVWGRSCGESCVSSCVMLCFGPKHDMCTWLQCEAEVAVSRVVCHGLSCCVEAKNHCVPWLTATLCFNAIQLHWSTCLIKFFELAKHLCNVFACYVQQTLFIILYVVPNYVGNLL